MIVRAPIVTIVAGPDWRDRIDVYGSDERVVIDGGNRRVMWHAEHSEAGSVDFSISWMQSDGWHVHATCRGHGGLSVSTIWPPIGGVIVQITKAGQGPTGLVEVRRIDT